MSSVSMDERIAMNKRTALAAIDGDRAEATPEASHESLTFPRRFTTAGVDPFDEVEWELRSAAITKESGEVVFEQADVEVPTTWSQMATNVVTSKYFRGAPNTETRERSVRQLIGRVVDTISGWAVKGGYFAADTDVQAFADELKHLLVTQKMSFNSPVWFNVGIESKPQCSACFINSVDDTMSSILTLARTEGMLFKYGSGTGTNLSPIRSAKETLSGGGTASGPVSFMRGYDAFAGVIKSGGKTRRAAKMVILDADHPDIVDFINCKAEEERKAWALIDAGYDGSLNGSAYGSVFFQNSNNSVRVSDEFMAAVEDCGLWQTRSRTSGDVVETFDAKDVMRQISEAAWICGDPGMQFDTTINRWHTCKNTARINASNPCSEYMFLDDSACNLASLNLLEFHTPEGNFDVESFRHAVRTTILAQEILVDYASYPTPAIERNSHDFRPLGLGYANLGALLMARGLPYDSDEGRAYAAAITSVMCGEAYATSAEVAGALGPFAGFALNREPMLDVMRMHRDAATKLDRGFVPADLVAASTDAWDRTVRQGELYGYRNSQVTVLAPTGTIAFMMDCDTTGIEPDIALVKYKRLVGGGMLKIVNGTVAASLRRLGYDEAQIDEIVHFVDAEETIEGAPNLDPEHLAVFDCAFRPLNGVRSIDYMGHIRMMAAVQPFLSGAISKTVNMPNDATAEEIAGAYMESWRLGIKAVAIYRDGCKRTQPLSTSRTETANNKSTTDVDTPRPYRRRLPDERRAITHKFEIAGHQGYITAGMYDDGTPGEIFLVMAKEGSTVSGLMDAFATAISMALQYGVPLEALVDKFSHVRFEPSGFTNNAQIRIAKSITDYIFRWLAAKFLSHEEQARLGVVSEEQAPDTEAETPMVSVGSEGGTRVSFDSQADAPSCHDCGSIMVRNGACYKCVNCGSSLGCS